MTFRIEIHSYCFRVSRFVALGCVGKLLVINVQDVHHMLSTSGLDFMFSFTNILLAKVLAVNTIHHIFSTTCEGQGVSFESVTPAACMRTHTG